ncbi:hypothetical protein Cci01nite_29930 [Catellatospora citrea]|uniref:Uncharacterized protein n=1 Tax=Catellatospora citrea TaxID=53366 RepID=A0A8J3KME0_9ACTN|nr:hypothetical protein Cci01nite_29930 [Catellatospora citrea]
MPSVRCVTAAAYGSVSRRSAVVIHSSMRGKVTAGPDTRSRAKTGPPHSFPPPSNPRTPARRFDGDHIDDDREG